MDEVSSWVWAVSAVMVVNGLLAIPFGMKAKREFEQEGRLGKGLAAWSGVAMHGHFLLTVLVSWLDRGSLYDTGALSIIGGVALLLLGAWIIYLGRKAYGDQRRVYGLLEGKIIDTGIYRWSRNPQYLGYALMFAGVAVVSGSVVAFPFVVVFLAMMHAGITLVEEPHLERVFGDEYARFKAKVGRYLSVPEMSKEQSGSL